MTETWYEILGVEPSASSAEIKSAWRSLVTVLGPTDHRFAAINEAATVLLDDDKRAEYDATISDATAVEPAVVEAVSDPVAEETPAEVVTAEEAVDEPTDAGEEAAASADETTSAPAPLSGTAGVLAFLARPATLVVASVLAVAALVTMLLVIVMHDGGSDVAMHDTTITLTDAQLHTTTQVVQTRDDADTVAAIEAAKAALPKILAPDYRKLDDYRAGAAAVLTQKYATDYLKVYDAMLKPNLLSTKSVVTTGPVLDAGVVGTQPGQVEVLMAYDATTTTPAGSAVTRTWVELTMVKTGEQWLVGKVTTMPVSS